MKTTFILFFLSFSAQAVETYVPYPVFKIDNKYAQAIETSAPHPVFKINNNHCISKQDCGEQPMIDQSTEELNQLYTDQVLVYFLDIIFENSFCECQGNDGCTRGCRLVSDLDKDQYPPISKCERKKFMHKSLAYCARHITGAMMTVIHDFLADHCQNTGRGIIENRTEYLQCLDDFREDVRNNNTNICRHGFRFSFALCMLNLDGQSAHIYNSIPNKDVRSTCKSWDQYNQSLLTMNVPLYNGEFVSIPLFNKISPERNKEFQMDPHKIPIGAIIITKSNNKHGQGHVEVKTDRRKCGRNKTQTCFCSDYCRERLRYDQPVLAVFGWNPEFIRYVNMNNY